MLAEPAGVVEKDIVGLDPKEGRRHLAGHNQEELGRSQWGQKPRA